MVVVVPSPTLHTSVVVLQDPLKTLDVSERQLAQVRGVVIVDFEFVLKVSRVANTGTYFVVLFLPLVEVLLQCLFVAVLKVFDSVVNDLGLVVLCKDPLDRHVALIGLVVALPILRRLIFRLGRAVRAFHVEFEGQDVLPILVDFVPGGVEMEIVDQFLDEPLISGGEVVDNGALVVGIGGSLMLGDKLLDLVERLLLVLCDD